MSGKVDTNAVNEQSPGVMGRLLAGGRRDLGRLLHTGVFHVFGALLGTQGMGMIRRVLLARILTKAELGQLTYGMRIVEFVGIIADLGICTSVLKFASEPQEMQDRRRIYITGLFAGAVASSFISLWYFIAVYLFAQPGNDHLRTFMLMLTAYIPVTALVKTPFLYMQACKRIKESARLAMITQAISLIMVVVATYFFGLWGFFTTVVIGPLANLLLLLWVTRQELAWLPPTRALLRKMAPLGLFAMLANAVGQGQDMITVVLLKHLGGSDEVVGIYAVAVTISAGARLLPEALMRVAFPYMSGLLNDLSRLRRRQYELCLKQLLFMCAVLLAFLLVGKVAIHIVFGERYVVSYPAALVLLCGLLFHSFGAPFARTVIVLNKVHLNFAGGLVQLLLTVGAGLILIPLYQAVGAASSIAAAQVVGALYLVWVGRLALRRQMNSAAAAGDGS